MGSLWTHLSVADLCQLLNDQDPKLLPSLKQVLPAVSGAAFNHDDLLRQATLERLVESFLPSEAFRNRKFRSACLNRLPPDKMTACAEAVGLAVRGGDFVTLRDAVAAASWRPPFAERFLSHFGLPSHFLPAEAPGNPDLHVLQTSGEGYPDGWEKRPFMQLQAYQTEVYHKAVAKLQTPRARFVVQMPTGAGKTRTAMEVVCGQLNEGDQPVVVWLAHADELCEQAFQCFLDVWSHLARRSLELYRGWGNCNLPQPAAGQAAFIVAGFQKFHAARKQSPTALEGLAQRTRIVIVDEAHKTEAPTYRETVMKLLGGETCVMGLTATPGRVVGDEAARLAQFYFQSLVGIEPPEGQNVIEMLRQQGVLSKAFHVPIMSEFRLELSRQVRLSLAERFDLPRAVLNAAGSDALRNIEIVKRLVQECDKGRQILFFACSVKHSKFITSTLLYLGKRAGHIDGTTGSARRKELIEGFRRKEVRVLCNFGVLSAGFDAPQTDVVFISRPTMSPVLYSQMIGRGLRGPRIGGTETCTIIDVRDNISAFGDAGRIYEMFDEYWNNKLPAAT